MESLEETAAKLQKSVAKPRDDINVAFALGADQRPGGGGTDEAARSSGLERFGSDVMAEI